MRLKYPHFLIAGILIFLAGCKNDNFEEIHPYVPEVCDTTGNISYNNEIRAIMSTSCGSNDLNCHLTGNTQDINLDNFFDTRDIATNGDLMGSILHEPGFTPMPDGGGKLNDCLIQKIQAWINRGEPEN
jgi:hypothetical protein